MECACGYLGGPDEGNVSERPIEASWLALRYRADARAREHSLSLVRAAAAHLRATSLLAPKPPAAPAVVVVDVGAGTGANLRWLGPHLDQALESALRQDWRLLDHDAALLDAVEETHPTWLRSSTRHTGAAGTLTTLLEAASPPLLVTCSALLDLLTPAQIDELVTATVAGADAALWSLSVTGKVDLTPGHADDARVSELFNSDQQRGTAPSAGVETLAGPDGWRLAAEAFTARGWSVTTVGSPWVLGTGDEPLVVRLLTERAAAASATDPGSKDQRLIESWLARRLKHLDVGVLSVRIDHTDLLALPVKSISEHTSSPR